MAITPRDKGSCFMLIGKFYRDSVGAFLKYAEFRKPGAHRDDFEPRLLTPEGFRIATSDITANLERAWDSDASRHFGGLKNEWYRKHFCKPDLAE